MRNPEGGSPKRGERGFECREPRNKIRAAAVSAVLGSGTTESSPSNFIEAEPRLVIPLSE